MSYFGGSKDGEFSTKNGLSLRSFSANRKTEGEKLGVISNIWLFDFNAVTPIISIYQVVDVSNTADPVCQKSCCVNFEPKFRAAPNKFNVRGSLVSNAAEMLIVRDLDANK